MIPQGRHNSPGEQNEMRGQEAPAPDSSRPGGICDTHMHFYFPGYPVQLGASAPSRGTFEDYQRLRSALGVERTVVVQPTAYGFDNRVTLAGMARLGLDSARGVAVVEEDAAERELRRLTQAGVRGLRLAMIPNGAIGWDCADAVVRRVQSVGWHTQLQMDGLELHERETQILGWPGDIVIDHIGKFSVPVTTEHPAVRSLLRLLETGRLWLKLSAPYWTARDGPPDYSEIAPLVRAFCEAAPTRMLWATNWPHPSFVHPPDDAEILNRILAWIPDPALRQRILVENPRQLYGF